MSKWPKDKQAALKKFYGDPGTDEVARQLVKITPPFRLYYDRKPIKTITVHKKASAAMLAAFTKIWDYYDHDQVLVDRLGISDYAGTYNPRKVRGSATKWSNHAYGAAIDLSPAKNGFDSGQGTMPKPVVAAFKSEGAAWGGDYRGRTDPMHFEFCDRGESQRTFEQWLRHYKVAPKEGMEAVEVAAYDASAPQPFLPEIAEDFDTTAMANTAPAVNLPKFTGVQGDPEIWNVQRRLDAMKYFPGDLDGKWGGKTGGAISAFINDREVSIAAPTSLEMFLSIKDALKAEMTRAESENPSFTRPIAVERATATATEVGRKIETVEASRASRFYTWILSIPAMIVAFVKGVLDNFEGALQSPILNHIKEFAADNIALLALGVVGVAGAIWYKGYRAERGVVKAHQEGRLS